jgi:murein DD-endopeptidase MepM/ murein hydrolase activator NlpD
VSWGSLEAKPAHRHRAGSAKATSASVHTVRRGETAGRIAKANGLSLDQLEALNPDRDLAHLSIGAKLRVAAKAPSPRALPVAAPATAPALEKGQTLYAFAKAHDLTVAELLEANPGLNPRRIQAGTRLNLPAKAAPVEALPAIPKADAQLARMETLLPRQAERAPEAAELAAAMKPVVPEPATLTSEPAEPFHPADPDHLDLLWPVETRTISSAWGPRMRTRVVRVKNRRKRRVRYRGRHKGVDLTAPIGTDVYAAMDGVVVYSGKEHGYGNVVKVDHGNGVMTVYAHHRANLVLEGDIVHRGQKIAEVGRTGNATGPHLHFELRINGLQQNPLPVLDDEEEIPAELAAQNATVGHRLLRR